MQQKSCQLIMWSTLGRGMKRRMQRLEKIAPQSVLRGWMQGRTFTNNLKLRLPSGLVFSHTFAVSSTYTRVAASCKHRRGVPVWRCGKMLYHTTFIQHARVISSNSPLIPTVVQDKQRPITVNICHLKVYLLSLPGIQISSSKSCKP